jgi:hypothetical protein
MSAVNSLTTFVPDLRTDEHLKLHELKSESEKVVQGAGRDMAKNQFVTLGTTIVNTACQAATSLHASLAEEEEVHRNELRMLKRMDERRKIAKQKHRGFGISFVAQLTSNTVNLGKNAVQSIFTDTKVDVTQMTEAYDSIGN